VKFFCKNCGCEGHRAHYCPERGENVDRRLKCGLCNKPGHNRRTCQKPRLAKTNQRILGEYHCRACGQVGHNSRRCTQKTKIQSDHAVTSSVKDFSRNFRRPYRCGVCGQAGHNNRSCSWKAKVQSDGAVVGTADSLEDSRRSVRRPYICRVCGEGGHNSRSCPQREPRVSTGLADFGRSR